MYEKSKKITSLLLSALLSASVLSACTNTASSDGSSASSEASDPAASSVAEAAKKDLQIACTSEPQSMDPHMSSSVSTRQIGRYIYEGLFELDSNYNPKPQLCESYTISDDNTEYTFKLRQGVKFHNGEEMKAADVVASLNRWASYNASAQKAITNGEQFYEIDDYTVGIKLDKPNILLVEILCAPSQFAAIMPASVIANSTEANGVSEYIGTSSLKFLNWVNTQYIKMDRFDDYSGPDSAIDGEAGNRVMNFDEVYFNFVSDATTTLTGLDAGEYDVVDNIGFDYLDAAEASDNISLYKYLQYLYALNYNKQSGLFTDINMRKAVACALDYDAMMSASLGGRNDEYAVMTSSVMSNEQTLWYSEEGSDLYNVHDADMAKSYLEAAGYNGEEIHVISTSAYSQIENAVLVMVQQLEAVGMNIKLDTYDWATFVTENKNPDGYDLFINMFPVVSVPHTLFYLSPRCGFTDTPELTSYFERTSTASSIDEASEIWKTEAQKYINNEMLLSKFADSYACMGANSSIKDIYAFQGYCIWGASE